MAGDSFGSPDRDEAPRDEPRARKGPTNPYAGSQAGPRPEPPLGPMPSLYGDPSATMDDLPVVPPVGARDEIGPGSPTTATPRARRNRRAPRGRLGLKVAAVTGGALIAVGSGAVTAFAVGGEPGQTAMASAPVPDAPRTPEVDQQALAAERERQARQRASRTVRKKEKAPVLHAKGTPIPTKTPKPTPSRTSGGGGGGGTDPVPAGEAQKIAKRLLPKYGFSGSGQFSCLVKLWDKESGWRHTAQNPSSGAYGIPQSLPGSKMASAGSDWRTNPETQIKWGLGYIKDRYGTPCSAWSHSQAKNWY